MIQNDFFIDLLIAELLIGFNLGIYLLFFRKQKQFRLNRLILMIPLIVAAFLPFMPRWNAGPVEVYQTVLPEVVISQLSRTGVAGAEAASSALIWTWLYLLISGFFAMRMLWMTARCIALVMRSKALSEGVRKGTLSPFTWMFWTVLPPREEVPEAILRHEAIHRRELHSLDLLIAELFLVLHWFSPFARYYKQMLVENHEFTADAGAMESAHADQYADLLVAEATTPVPQLVHSFLEQSLLKNRLRMMYQTPSRKGVQWLYAAITPILAATILIACSKAEESSFDTAGRAGVYENPITEPETMPEYPGGVSALMTELATSVVYPEAAKEEGTEGTVMVKFTVGTDGSVGDVMIARGVSEALDQAATDAVKKLKTFTPGSVDGKPVAVTMVLPVKFQLQ